MGNPFLDSVRNVMRRFLQPERESTENTSGEHRGQYRSSSLGSQPALAFYDWYRNSLEMSGARIGKYTNYEFLDENLAEAEVALNVYADTIVAGTIGGEEVFWVMIDKETPDKDTIEEIVSQAEQKTGIKEQVWELARQLTKYGDLFTEVIIEKDDAGGLCVKKLKELPVKEIFADVDRTGSFIKEEFPYYQLPPLTGQRIDFDWWRMIHFKIGSGIYGYNYSIFARSSNRVGRQLIWIDDALVLARMSRAWMRYVYLIDVEGLSPDAALEYVQKYMDRLRRKETIDRNTGRVVENEGPMLPDEDIGLPISANGKTDVKQLSGDMNVGNIRDVYYLQNKFFMGTSMPKAYASIEEGVSTRATITQIDIQFARQVRRRQQALIPGLKQFYRRVFLLAGRDPDSFKWSIEFPALATMDELTKWQIENVKSQVAQVYTINMGLLNSDWVYREVLKLGDEEIKKYSAPTATPPPEREFPGAGYGAGDDFAGTDAQQLPPDFAKMVNRDPFIRKSLEELQDIVSWRRAHEKALQDGVPVGIRRKGKLRSDGGD